MLAICEKAGKCEIVSCVHKIPHISRQSCTGFVCKSASKGTICVPVTVDRKSDHQGLIFNLHFLIDSGDKDEFIKYLLANRSRIHQHSLENAYAQQLYILVLERAIDLLF